MVCKLFAIIECDGMDMFLEWCEQFYAGFSHQLGGFAFNLGDEGQASHALHQCDDGLFVMCANDCITFPVSQLFTGLTQRGVQRRHVARLTPPTGKADLPRVFSQRLRAFGEPGPRLPVAPEQRSEYRRLFQSHAA